MRKIDEKMNILPLIIRIVLYFLEELYRERFGVPQLISSSKKVVFHPE